MLPGSRRGPKDKRWTKAVRASFADFFAKRSEPLNPAEKEAAPLVEATGAGLSWLFLSFGDEPTQVRAAEGGPVRNIILGITGALAALGHGQAPGVGSCHEYWVDASDVEVPEATAGAVRRVRGGTGDLQLRLADGTAVWCTAHHCRPWRLEDGEPLAAASPLLPTVPMHEELQSPSPPPPLSPSPELAADGEESEADEAPVQPARAAPAKGKGKRAAPPPRAPPAKRAATTAGSSSAARAQPAGKRAARPPPDSSDEEAQSAAKKVAATKPKPKPKGKGKGKAN